MSNYRFGDVTDPPLVFERIWPEGGGGQGVVYVLIKQSFWSKKTMAVDITLVHNDESPTPNRIAT